MNHFVDGCNYRCINCNKNIYVYYRLIIACCFMQGVTLTLWKCIYENDMPVVLEHSRSSFQGEFRRNMV